jgi:putative oxidoreductase
MNTQPINRLLDGIAKAAGLLHAPFAFATRIYVGWWVFFRSGWLKITDWEQTISLFESEYRVPVLSPFWGAVTGTAGELIFSALLIVGLGGRLPALGLFFVNVMAVVSYWHEFSVDSGIAGLRQHHLWGFMLAMLFIYGSGPWSLDRVLGRREKP